MTDQEQGPSPYLCQPILSLAERRAELERQIARVERAGKMARALNHPWIASDARAKAERLRAQLANISEH